MQLSSIYKDGSPSLCHVWYSCSFAPDRLYFISRKDRDHSANIRRDPRVAGGIVSIPLSGLGQTVQGVTFKGRASQLADDSRDALAHFIDRWPDAAKIITVDRIAQGLTSSRLFEVSVEEWVLFDEANFPESPRRTVSAETR